MCAVADRTDWEVGHPDATDRYDVVVVGGGMSGLSAGITAAEAGGRVAVLDAAPHPGGSMVLSGGLVWTARDLPTMRREIPRGDPALQAQLVHRIDEGWHWLEGHGVPLGPERACMVADFGRGRMLLPGSPGRRGPVAATLVGRLILAGGALQPASRAVSVRRQADGIFVRVADQGIGGWRVLRCAAVVFAGGGFQNDTDLLRRFVTPHADRLLVRSNRFSDGLAVRSAAGLGAALSGGMYSFYGHSMPVTDHPLDPSDFIAAAQFYSNHCAVVNLLGLRFTDETAGHIDECNAQAGSRQIGARYFTIFDEGIRRGHVSVGEVLPGIVNSLVEDRLAIVRERGGRVFTAASAGALAALLERERGVPARNLLDTIEAYNAQQSGPSHPVRAGGREPLVEPPFYAVECVPGITYTMGGLAVDDAMRVLDESGSPVSGVFAAGADAGHVFEDVYGGGLAWALVSGLVAGTTAAAAAGAACADARRA